MRHELKREHEIDYAVKERLMCAITGNTPKKPPEAPTWNMEEQLSSERH